MQQVGGAAHFQGIPPNKMYAEETIKLVREKTGDDIIQTNPLKDNQAPPGPQAPPRDEFIMNENYKGWCMIQKS